MYRAPEMIDLYLRPMLTEKTDIWALGCVLYAMCFLTHPFADGSSLGILNGKVTFPADSPYDPSSVHALIMRMLDVSTTVYCTILCYTVQYSYIVYLFVSFLVIYMIML